MKDETKRTGISESTRAAFSFNAQLEVGQAGEDLFLKHYHRDVEVIPEHYADFRCKTDGRIVELKTDTYRIEDTPNFFIERYSDVNKKSPGGIWQSLSKGVDIFVYMFIRDEVYFEFENLPALVERVELLETKQPTVFVKNRGWITAGYKVRRELLQDLYTVHCFNSSASEINSKVKEE